MHNNKLYLIIKQLGYQYGYQGYSHQDWRNPYPYVHQMYMPQYSQIPQMASTQQYMPFQMPQKKVQGDKDDPHAPTINSVVQQVTQELKAILKRDFNKRMIENTAFKKFETWWEEESSKENKTKGKEESQTTEKTTTTTTTKDNINVLLESNRENLYSNVNLDNLGLGLGFRASLPKMPSFRRKKIPSPVPEDEDSRKLSDNEEIVHSDSESRTSALMRRIRKTSTSSSSSSTSSAFSSDSDSSASEDSSSDTETEVKQMNRTISPIPSPTTTTTKSSSKRPPSRASGKHSPKRNARVKTPEPMQVVDVVEPVVKNERISEKKLEKPAKTSSRYSKIFDSDSDMSEGEMEYLERRRKNTEWMEQIERERKEREAELATKKPPTPIIQDIDEEMKNLEKERSSSPDNKTEADSKTLEELEAEREALLRAVRNPDAPLDDETEEEERRETKKKKVQDDVDVEKKMDKKREDLNGAIDVSRRSSESSTGGSSSPSSQVAMEHSYCMPCPEKENTEIPVEVKQSNFVHDHGYTSKQEKVKKEKPPKVTKPRKPKEHKKLQELQNTLNYQDREKKNQQFYNIHSGVTHKIRDQMSEFGVLYEFLTKGGNIINLL